MEAETIPSAELAAELAAEVSLQDALDTLRRSEKPALPPAVPPRLGGMATPLGVYLHDGTSSGGAGFWGLLLTGMTMSVLALTAQFAAHTVSRLVSIHAPALGVWESRLPFGLPLWLSAISPWLPLPFVFLLLRLIPLSGIHAAEHQVVHCVERRETLTIGMVRTMPCVHPRCGTNIFAGFTLFLISFLGVFCITKAQGWLLLDSVTLAAMLSGPLTLIYWRRVGGWVQRWLATRPATDGQIAGAIFAAEQVLARHQRLGGRCLRFAHLRRIWTMGLAQILLGYAVVIGLLTLAELVWPGLGHWLE